VTFSRRRIAIIATGAVAALVVGYLAGQILIPQTHNPPPISQNITGGGSSGATGGAGLAPTTATTPPASTTTTPATATTTPATGATSPGAGGLTSSTGAPNSHAPLTAFSDRVGGFSMSYPKGWTRLSSTDAGVRLLASGPDGASMLVRLATLGVSVDGRTLDELEAATGQFLQHKAGVTIVAGPKLLSINNLPGYLYIYSFVDPSTHEKSAHSQIVLFSGKRMYTLVYQTAQAAALVTLAPLFDQVTDTFHAH
jgi:hypothetical protein